MKSKEKSFQMIEKIPLTSTRKGTEIFVEPDQNLGITKIPIAQPFFCLRAWFAKYGFFLSQKYACMQKISPILLCLASFGPVLACLAPFGPIRAHLTLFGPVCPCLAPFGTIFHHLAPFGPT